MVDEASGYLIQRELPQSRAVKWVDDTEFGEEDIHAEMAELQAMIDKWHWQWCVYYGPFRPMSN